MEKRAKEEEEDSKTLKFPWGNIRWKAPRQFRSLI